MAELIITLEAGADLRKVAARLKACGFQVQQELEALDMLTGQGEVAEMATFQAVEGVAAVEISESIQIPPVGPQSGSV